MARAVSCNLAHLINRQEVELVRVVHLRSELWTKGGVCTLFFVRLSAPFCLATLCWGFNSAFGIVIHCKLAVDLHNSDNFGWFVKGILDAYLCESEPRVVWDCIFVLEDVTCRYEYVLVPSRISIPGANYS